MTSDFLEILADRIIDMVAADKELKAALIRLVVSKADHYEALASRARR